MGRLLYWFTLALLAFWGTSGGQGHRTATRVDGDTEGQFAHSVLQAFQKAYPDKNMVVARRNGEWSVQLNQKWFAWADGRLLPESERAKQQQFKRFGVYFYPAELPPQPFFSPEGERAFQQRLRSQRKPLPLHREFVEELYLIRSRVEAETKMKNMRLAGKNVRLNQALEPIVSKLRADIAALSSQNPEVARFLQRVETVSGFNWRNVSYFNSISYHSLGLALDFIPARWDAPVYWYWSRDQRDDWYNIPYHQRWQVPAALVKLFEEHGFIWGGKWLFFDNMHFEYRPELLELSKLPRELWPQFSSTQQADD